MMVVSALHELGYTGAPVAAAPTRWICIRSFTTSMGTHSKQLHAAVVMVTGQLIHDGEPPAAHTQTHTHLTVSANMPARKCPTNEYCASTWPGFVKASRDICSTCTVAFRGSTHRGEGARQTRASYVVKYSTAAGAEPTNVMPNPRYRPRRPSCLQPHRCNSERGVGGALQVSRPRGRTARSWTGHPRSYGTARAGLRWQIAFESAAANAMGTMMQGPAGQCGHGQCAAAHLNSSFARVDGMAGYPRKHSGQRTPLNTHNNSNGACGSRGRHRWSHAAAGQRAPGHPYQHRGRILQRQAQRRHATQYGMTRSQRQQGQQETDARLSAELRRRSCLRCKAYSRATSGRDGLALEPRVPARKNTGCGQGSPSMHTIWTRAHTVTVQAVTYLFYCTVACAIRCVEVRLLPWPPANGVAIAAVPCFSPPRPSSTPWSWCK